MDSEDIRGTLLTLGVLDHLSPDLRGKVAQLLMDAGKPVSLEPGEVLIREGDVGGGAGYVLLSGSMRVEHERDTAVRISAPALLGEMHQFNPRALRTATVTADTPCALLKFAWFDFQYRATSELTHIEQDALMETMEQLVWQRFHQEPIFNVPCFEGIDPRTRLRLCLTLVWLAKDLHLPEGAVLFQQQELQGGAGYVLLKGNVALARAGQSIGTLEGPALIGAATSFNPRRTWSATATAKSGVDLLQFEWPELEAYLVQRLGEPDTRKVLTAIEGACPDGFVD